MSFDDNKLPEGTLKKCPKFIEWNKQCITDLTSRYSKHNKHRAKCIKCCVDETLYELNQLYSIKSSSIPIFIEKDDILCKSINEMNCLIKQTSTVQPAKCKKKILTYQQFTRKAICKQDQNSWKISGKHFFSPYIELFSKFIKTKYLLLFPNTISNHKKDKIFQLSCLIFAVKLLSKTVKFDRAKEKPLIRDRTLVKSYSLHHAFKKLYYKLNVPKFFSIEKAKRKKIKKGIDAQQFHEYLLIYTKYLLNTIKNNQKNMNINDYNFPYDWINDNNNNSKKEEETDNDNDIDICDSYSEENDSDNTSDNNTVNTMLTDNISINNNNIIINNSNNNRIFQSTNNFNNISNGINKGLLCIDLDIKRDKNRKINQEMHLNQMRIIPINQLGNELVFDVAPTGLSCIGSETIINGDMYTNDMGYSFNK